MKIIHLILAFILSSSLHADIIKNNQIDSIADENSLMDTSDLDLKLKLFLEKFYQKNFSNIKFLKRIKSVQFIGEYSVNGENRGTIKIIKKKPNKYKSYIKRNNNTELVIVYDGKNLQEGFSPNADSPIKWKTLDTTAPENLWIYFEQLFYSIMLNPKDPNKELKLGVPFTENGKVIQPVCIKLENKIRMTNFIPISDNLTQKTFLEFNEPDDPNYTNCTIYFENYESINGVMFPKKITTKINDNYIVTNNFSQIETNLGISDFFFKAISF